MSDLQSGVAATGTGVRSRPRAVLPALCLTQITSWGTVYYAFIVLNPAITADTGWSADATTAAFSAALVVSAVAGIHVGRVLDHRGPRTVMTAGSALGALRPRLADHAGAGAPGTAPRGVLVGRRHTTSTPSSALRSTAPDAPP